MNFKKFAFLGLVMIALLAFAGCNGETTTATTASTTAATTTTVSTTATTTEPTTVTTATTVSELTDAEKAQAVLDALDLGDLTAVTADLTLPSPTTDGVAVTWATSDAAVITAAGVITTPRYGQGDATATLTATATLNDAAPTRQFTVVVAEESVSAYLTRIGNSIIITNSDAITADFLIPGAYGSGDAQATITWVSGNTDIATVSAAVDEDGFYTVTVTRPKADDGGVNTSVILTATIAIGEDDLEVQKTILVLAESSSTPVTTIAEGMELPFGTNVKWEDMTVFGIDEAGFFFTDGTDLMYVYGSDYAAQVTVGEVYDIIGPISLYNAVPEVQDAGSVVVKINDSEATARTLAPTTATIAEIIANHEGYDSADPMKFGYYTVTAKSFYYDHLKGDNYNTYLVPTDATVLDKEEAIRVYYKSNKAAVEALHGETITLNIVIFAFNSGADYGDWYADFLGTADDITVAFASDQDAVDAALATLQFPNAILEATTLDLPASIYGVDLTYASTDAAVISPTTGVVDLTSLTTQVSVDLTVSAAKGSATGQQVFTIKVGELPLLDIATALTKADGEIIKVQGVVTKVDSNNFFIQDATGGMMVYQGSSSTFTSLAVPGNLVEIEGELDFYNNLVQIRYPDSVTVISEGNPLPTPVAVVGADNDTLMEHIGELVTVTGLYVDGTPSVSTNSYTIYLTDGINDVQLRVDKYGADFADINVVAATLVDGQGVTLTAIAVGAYNVPQLMWLETEELSIMTDTEMLDYDAATLPTSLSLVTDYTFPTLTYSTMTVKTIPTELASYLADGTTKLTFTSPAATVTGDVVFTLTVNSGTATKDVTIPVEVRLMTPEEKLAEDKAALTIETAVNEFDEATLPTSGLNGSVITWEVEGSIATLDAGVVTYNYNNGVAYQVDLTATLTVDTTYTDSKVFTVSVSPVTIVTDLSLLTALTGEAWTMPDGNFVYIQGVVTGNSYDGLFLQDANGVGFFMYKPFETGINIGDEVVYYGKLKTYSDGRQLDTGAVLLDVVSTNNDLVVTTVTADDIDAFAAQDAGSLFKYAGFTFESVSTSYPYSMTLGYTLSDGITEGTVTVRFHSSWDDLKAIADYYTVGDEIPETQFILYNFRDGLIQLDVVSVAFSDADFISFDAAGAPATLILEENFIIPAGDYGSTFTVTGITGDAAAYIDYTTTPGTLIVTLPTDADKTGVITIEVSKGTATAETITIDVTVKKPITILYSTGFETTDPEAYTASTTYSGTKTYGNWTVVEGTVSTTDGLPTDQHIQMRDYSTTVQAFPYTQYNSPVAFNNVRLNTFSNQSSGFQLVIQFSTDGTTWSTGTTIDLTTTDTMHEVASDVTDATYVRFTVNHSITPDKQRVNIDDVIIF